MNKTYSFNWKRYYKLLAIWLAILGHLWILADAGKEFEKNKRVVYFLMLIGSFALTLLHYYLYSLYLKNRKKTPRNEIFDSLNRIREKVYKLNKDKKDYELRIFKWRTNIEEGKLRKINSGLWVLEALQTYEYSRYIFGNILNTLEEGDTYITLSNINFWSEGKFNNADFVNYNLDATRRGVGIKRIIIINNRIFKKPNKHKKELVKLTKIIKRLSEASQRNPAANVLMSNLFYISKDYTEDARSPVPFAIITNETKKQYIIISPHIKDKLKKDKSKKNIQNPNKKNPEIWVKIHNNFKDLEFNNLMQRYIEISNTKGGDLLDLKAMTDKINSISIT